MSQPVMMPINEEWFFQKAELGGIAFYHKHPNESGYNSVATKLISKGDMVDPVMVLSHYCAFCKKVMPEKLVEKAKVTYRLMTM